jgi:hypothetical protein
MIPRLMAWGGMTIRALDGAENRAFTRTHRTTVMTK